MRQSYSEHVAENHERYFVPSIGAPIARDLIDAAALRPGERVLDVGCGTGVVTRMAAERVGASGRVAGLDVNPGMLAVARAAARVGDRIDWYEASAETLPVADDSFDVVLAQMSLQFIGDKGAALREMQRVLAPGGRMLLDVPGPAPRLFAILADALAKHIAEESALFVHRVFSLNDPDELRELVNGAGFDEIEIRASSKRLQLPPSRDFLWQYIHSTPLARSVRQASRRRRASLQEDVCERWREFTSVEGMSFDLRMMTGIGR